MNVPADKGAHAGGKVTALVAGMVAGADSIDDMALLRHGALGRVFDRTYAPSTLGSFLRAFTFGHVRVRREALITGVGVRDLRLHLGRHRPRDRAIRYGHPVRLHRVHRGGQPDSRRRHRLRTAFTTPQSSSRLAPRIEPWTFPPAPTCHDRAERRLPLP